MLGNTFRIPHEIDTFQIAAGIVNLGSNAVQIKDGNSFGATDANNSFFIYSDKLVDQHASEITRNTFGRADSSSWRQVELQGAQDSLQIFCNNFRLSAGTDFAVGLETGTTLMAQGTPERPAGNDWNTLESCMFANDESHIFSTDGNDSFGYIGFLGRVPDCVSYNVDTSSIIESQDPIYCNIEVPCPECGTEIIDSIHLAIDTLIRNPPWGMSQAEIDQRINYNIHTRNLKVQDILIDYIEQDSLDKALAWLDSVAIRTSAYDSIKILLQERYDQTPQRPGSDKSILPFRSINLIEVICERKKEIKRLTPLTKTKNSPLESENITDPPIDPLEKLFIIFPNPTQSAFTIRLISSVQVPIWKFKVRDIHGRVKFASSFVEGNEVNVEAWQWAGGIYFIEINFGDRITHMARIVILD